MQDNIIEFNQVSKIYRLYRSDKYRLLDIFQKHKHAKQKIAVDRVSFSIQRGEAVAILGKNGAGKSTLLKMITGVCFPTEGELKVNGVVSALLELTAGFDTEFTGMENIFLKGQLMGIRDKDIRSMVDDIVDFAEIGEYIDQPVRTYSSGMKARLGFSINVNVHPEILIVDEALSVGDAAFRRKCLDRVNRLIQQENVTLLFVTHSSSVAQEFCQRGILMDKGAILFDGEIDLAVSKYNTLITPTKRSS